MRKIGVLVNIVSMVSMIFVAVFVVCLLVFSSVFVFADIDVHNFTFTQSYSPYQFIEGEINLTIEEESYNYLLTSNLNTSGVLLGDFLEDNGYFGDDFCTPSDCSNDYDASDGLSEKTILVLPRETSYAGFVLTGDNVEVTGLSFELESDFDRGAQLPLKIEFFEFDLWEYAEFSNEYSPKDYGCYNVASSSPGPLIRTSEYCEKISISETDSLEIGAEVDSADSKHLKMTLYSDFSGSSLGNCSFNPATEEGCQVYADADTDKVYSEGDYYICVSALTGETTNYSLYDENSGTNCGFVYSASPGNFTKDYAIFAKTAMYEAAETNSQSNLQILDEDFEDFILSANDVLNERYGGDCSNDCVLPFAIQGVGQDLVIKNLVLDYKSGGEDQNPEDKIYDLDTISALVDFSGVLDLELLGFEVFPDDEEFILYLDGDEIFEEDINILDEPIVNSVSPINPPAGVPITFYAGVDFNGNISSYEWDFGDGTSDTTFGRTVRHTYDDIGNYTLELEVFAGNLSNSASFSIEATNPEDAVNISLKKMSDELDDVVRDINAFPVWYQDALEEFADVIFYQGELQRLEGDFEDAFEDSDFVDVAIELYDLDVPKRVFISNQESSPLLTDLDDIDPLPVQMIGGGSEETLDGYKNPILRWQTENIDADFLLKKIVLMRASGEKENIMAVYSVNVNSNANEESFYVIGKDFNDLFFDSASDPGARREGDSTAFVLDKEEEKSFKFYYLADSDDSLDEVGMFVSPKLSHLILEADVDTTCDHDGICEASLGEDSSTCRSDCKPVFGMILWMVLAFVFVLILYTVLQVWYKTKYEKSLFKDRRHLHNILMFIANGRARGMSDDKIRVSLKKQKWTNEQINYALKKSQGQRTGMYEIIPVEKIFAGLRQRKANKNFITGNMRQNSPNINKPLMRR